MDDLSAFERWNDGFERLDSFESLQEALQEALSLCRQCIVFLSRATGYPFELQNWMDRLASTTETSQETLFEALALFLKHILYLLRDMMYDSVHTEFVFGTATWQDVTRGVLLKAMCMYQNIEDSKIEIYTRNKTEKTALMSQSLNERNKRKLEILLVNGADVNAQDIHGNTVLHYAAWIDCDIDIAKLLKGYGASPVKDKLGQLPFQIAQKRGHALLAQELCSCHNKEHLKEVTFHNECIYFCTQGLSYLPNDNSIQKRLKYFHRDSILDLLSISGIGKVIFDGEAGEIRSVISEIVKNICDDIGQTNRMFSNKVFPSGSVNEETKVGLPDEFDFICHLDKLSTMCDIESCTPNQTFVSVSLRVKQEFWAELEGLQDEKHHIEAECVWQKFIKSLKTVVKKRNFYQHPNITLVGEEFDNMGQTTPNCKLTFRWSGCEYKDMEINVDISPALQIPGWWPSKADFENLPFDTKRVQQDGALLLFHGGIDEDCTETNSDYSDVFYMDIRPSAATAERAYIKQLPQLARDAYMVSKILCNERISPRVQLPVCTPILEEKTVNSENILSSYILKNCLFHVFADETNRKGTSDKFCLHDYVCKIFEMVHNFCGENLGSFVFKENIFSPQYEHYDPCVLDRIQYRKYYSKLILLLLSEPDNWISEIKGMLEYCRKGSEVQIHKHL